MLSLPEFAQMIEHNNELLANEQKINENMKDTLEKSKKSCKYTEKFKLKCDEIIRQFNEHVPKKDEEILYDLTHDAIKGRDLLIKNYEELSKKYEELDISHQNMIVNRYTNLPDFAIVINCLEDELNEIKNENNKLQGDIVKNNDQYDLSIAFNELYFRICDYLNSHLKYTIIVCDDCLNSYLEDFEDEAFQNLLEYKNLSESDEMLTLNNYNDYCSNCNTQPLCSHCWYKHLIGE